MKVLKSSIFFILFSFLTFNVYAEGVFDGIYNTNPNIGYAYLKENIGSVIVVLNQTIQDDLQWNAASGNLIGNAVRLYSLIGYNTTVTDVTFTSNTTFTATQVSCVAGKRTCLFPNGTTFTGNKIW